LGIPPAAFGDYLNILSLPPSLLKKIKGVKCCEVPARHGDSAALREIQGSALSPGPGGAAGLPPSLAESLLASPLKAQIPAGAFANRPTILVPNPGFAKKTSTPREQGRM